MCLRQCAVSSSGVTLSLSLVTMTAWTAPLLARHADHGGLAHGRMQEKRAFDLDRIDILSARHDHVLYAVRDIHISVRVHCPRVARTHPCERDHGTRISTVR